MKRHLAFFSLCGLLMNGVLPVGHASADFPEHVTVVKSESNKTVTVAGKLEDGKVMETLSWAWSGSNACFPETQSAKFGGNHVLYATTLPTRSIMTIKVTPEDPNVNLSLYAYSMHLNEFKVVPDLRSCITCEADYKWDQPWKGKTQDSSRWVELNAVNDQLNVVIGVTAPEGVVAGKFKLEISVKS